MMRTRLLWVAPLLLALPLGAHAKCSYSSGGATTVTFSLPPAITIAADAAVGTVLATSAQTAPLSAPVISCNGQGDWMTYGVTNTRGGYLADNITYETGIPGLGYRLTHPNEYLKRYPLSNAQVSSSTFSVSSGLELIKTGTIDSGSVLAAGELGQWRWDDERGNALYPETFILGNSITFTTPSCTIVTDPINVALPTVASGAFTGVGSTSGKTPFQITLNCPAGATVTNITMHSTAPDSHQGVVQPSGAGYAAGIGVELLDGNSNAVVFEQQTVVSPPNATTAIPYFAQYFQTAATVSGGPVKATVTFDIFYQ